MRISDWSSDVCSSDLASSQQFLPLVSTILAPSDARRIDNRTFLGDPDYDTLKQRTASVTLIADHQFSEAVSISGRARYIDAKATRSEEHTSELQSLMRISYAVFCLKTKNKTNRNRN